MSSADGKILRIRRLLLDLYWRVVGIYHLIYTKELCILPHTVIACFICFEKAHNLKSLDFLMKKTVGLL